MDLKEKIKKLPSSPGVYFMKDSLGTIIYVGKSKNLKSRVGSYFANSKSHSTKVQKLVRNLKDFDHTLTDTEFEALLLECKCIKEIKPIYNRLMKSPKSYCYIKIKINERYPNIEICNQLDSSDKNLYFGPYTNKNTVEKGLNAIKDHLKILCANSAKNASGCLMYQKKLCIGMCTTNPTKEYYFYLIEKIINLLSGKDVDIIKEIEDEMNKAAINFDFELAAKYRDYIKLVRHFINYAEITNFIESNKNIVLMEHLNDEEIKVFLIRYNKVIFSKIYKLSNFTKSEIKYILKSEIVTNFTEVSKRETNIGKDEIDEVNIIYNYLKSKNTACKYIAIKDSWLENVEDLNVIDKFVNTNIN
ncbi:UvrB/UvrC motif-containing protein [Clostridium sp. SHJSY1]|uniref:UvrB/UvrC motif-containing protein n=1 Tax=Clostridium sp. SHJSY1 TaxID=2942483 RepID=UPI002875E493|nr:UvrB/UvrC motif-containing protein [Clostridium sp. SHJSY1]MDS0524700.1 UvrB/UvrC motif-containing protein [Clostridium sp. SHJSY1]